MAVARTLRGPVFFPLRALATVVHRRLPRAAADHRAVLFGFGVPALRLQGVPPTWSLGGTALVLTYWAYVAEVFRAGIESVHPAQRAAARSLGLTYAADACGYVVLPQAVRRVAPPLLNDLVSLQKDVGLISMLGADRRDPGGADRRRRRLQLHAVRRGRACCSCCWPSR